MIERLTSTQQDGIHEIGNLTVVAGSDEEIWMVVSSVEVDRRDSVYMASVFISHNEKDAPSKHKQSSVENTSLNPISNLQELVINKVTWILF